MAWGRLRRVAGGVAAIALFGAAVPIAAVVWVRVETDSQRVRAPKAAPEAEAAIVLGASVFASGRPSPIVEGRLQAALALYRGRQVKKVLVSGDHGQASYDEVNAMARWLIKQGLPEADVFRDHAGFRTFDTMARAAKVFLVRRAVICTQGFHLPRAVFLARQAGIEAFGVEAAPHTFAGGASLQDLVREAFATLVALGDVFVWKRQPRFLGPPIPIDGDGRATKDRKG